MVKILLGQVRYDKHITLKKLAVLSGVSKSAISEIENEKKNPTINTLCALARALQVPITDLFEDTNGIKT